MHCLVGCSKHVVTDLAVKQVTVPPTQKKKASWKAWSALKLGREPRLNLNKLPALSELVGLCMQGNTYPLP